MTEVLFHCEKCKAPVEKGSDGRARIWPRKCASCILAERGERDRSAHIDTFPEAWKGYNYQLDEVITGRRQIRDIIKRTEDESGGRVKLDWH